MPTLYCGPRDFYLSGRDADLFHNKRLSCLHTIFNIAGFDASLTRNRVPLEAGLISIVHGFANLEYNRLFSCEAGAFTLSGQDATLTYAVGRLEGDAGAISLTGADATLTYLEILQLALEAGQISLGFPSSAFIYYEHLPATNFAEFIITTYGN